MKSEDLSKYVVKDPTNGIYRYYRRVPTEVAHLDSRVHVKKSLKTKNHKEALERAETLHKASESYWKALLEGKNAVGAVEEYQAAVKAAQSLGFTYRPATEAALLDLAELERRLRLAQQNMDVSPTIVDASLGTARQPRPKISDIWTLYTQHNEAGLTGLSRNQMRKHQVSRERAIRYVKDVLGDVDLQDITRADTIRFRDWWVRKIKDEKLKAYSANRSFTDLAGMLSVIDDALQTEFHKAWEKLRIKETNATKLEKRPPFPVAWVRDKILAPGALDGLNPEGQAIIQVMAETGMRLTEVCNLRPEDIRLDDEIPHVEVAERDDRRNKTEYSVRRIPLVGVALEAMKRHPNGLPLYHDKSDGASANINKYLMNAGLRPTKRHTAYSLRHTFQDRIENAGASDRMQADLMGHEFGRPTYGDGAEMQRRLDLLEKIKIS
ncbi:tyrosine-type recombinase/integrase [Rhizobium sp. CG4]|uniref:tyrosine-type recombinase/integrase n=1 Tax=Rhizobium sp. CG4 TaxID=2726075 RepID=UPI002033F260|nr:tyrosine-type recombinase/integrase [Rhizobium sp. CG4]MCM2455281.1 tyrosine-type recombinase/integrase [Rhizobium sp. CG4]